MGAAEKLIEGEPKQLAFDIPECNIEAGEGSGRESPSSWMRVVVERCPEDLGVERVPAREVASDKMLNQLLDLFIVGHAAGVTQPVNIRVVGVELEDEPIAAGVAMLCRKPAKLNVGDGRHYRLTGCIIALMQPNWKAKACSKWRDALWLGGRPSSNYPETRTLFFHCREFVHIPANCPIEREVVDSHRIDPAKRQKSKKYIVDQEALCSDVHSGTLRVPDSIRGFFVNNGYGYGFG